MNYNLSNFDWGSNDSESIQIITEEVFRDKIYERYFAVNPGYVVLDIGANCGAFAHSILHRNPSRIFCIEPSDTMTGAIAKNTLGHPVTIIEKAIGAKTEDNVLLEGKEVYVYFPKKNTFDTIEFKDLLNQYKIDKIDFMKIDCEGGEYDLFTEENYDFILNNVKYIVGEWHVTGQTDGVERFIKFRDRYLKQGQFRFFERNDRECTSQMFDDKYLYEFRDWWNRWASAQWTFYISNVGRI